MMKKIVSILLLLSLLLSFAACTQSEDAKQTTQATQTETQPTETKELTEEEKILAQRREIVVEHMYRNAELLWRAAEDVEYVNNNRTFRFKAGQLYRGMPYTYAGGTVEGFLDYAGQPDEKGIYTISGITPDSLSGSGREARMGNDCSAAVVLAMGQVSTTITGTSCAKMLPANGFIPVGDYEYILNEEGVQPNSGEVILHNGLETMYKSYAQLQRGDCAVHIHGNKNHAILIVDVEVVYNEAGELDPVKSVVTFVEQTSTAVLSAAEGQWDEELGEDVIQISGIDNKKTFKMLGKEGYLPLTCQELIDPAPLAETVIEDTESEFNKDNILVGTITSNRFIDSMTMVITDAQGAEVQSATAYGSRSSYKTFDLQKFINEAPAKTRGVLDISALASGSYHCTLVCRLTTGEEFTARDFDFTV